MAATIATLVLLALLGHILTVGGTQRATRGFKIFMRPCLGIYIQNTSLLLLLLNNRDAVQWARPRFPWGL